MVVAEKRNHTVVVQQGARMVEALVSKRGRVVPPVRVICVVVRSSGWWIICSHIIDLFSHHISY